MREKMKISDRAKIFAPFDALKGFREALKDQERIETTKAVLTEDRLEELQRIFLELEVGNLVKIKYYEELEKQYLEVVGIITKIDVNSKMLSIVKKKYAFDDIVEIEIKENYGLNNQ